MPVLTNSTTPVGAHGAAMEPGTIAIIGFVLAVIGTLQSGLFTYTAMVGLGKPDGWVPPPEEWGKPWPFSMATGLDGTTSEPNATEPLIGSGGPFPDVHLFNDNGEYLGAPKNKNYYIGKNKALALDIYPINVHDHESQYATFVILAAKGNGRDPLCIVDFGLGRPNDMIHILSDKDFYLIGSNFDVPQALDEQAAAAFGAYTALSCGASWYYSGVYRKDLNGTSPCFWLGGYGVQGMQVHLPSHTIGQTRLPVEDMNATIEQAHDCYCNRPAVLSLWEKLPARHKVTTLLETDLDKRAGKTVNDTLRLHDNGRLMEPGKPSSSRRSVQSSSHENTVTIAHELTGLSAAVLCENGMSMGPDFVNIPEGKFCRMSDKTLWPTCDHRSQIGPTDDCFDVESKQLVVGGKVTRSMPYSKEINYPLK